MRGKRNSSQISMAAMEASPPRRRETFTSLQLQRAADQLQDAIQSVRQRRSMQSSRSTNLSLLSDSSGDEMVEDPEDSDGDDDQENRPANGSSDAVSKHDRLQYSHSLHGKLCRFTADASASAGRRVSGGSLSLKDLHASPLRPPRDLEAMKQRVHSDVKKPVDSETTKPAQSSGESMLKSVEPTVNKALAVLQTELEGQAKANRAMQEHIKDAVGRMSAFVAQAVGCGGGESLQEDTWVNEKLLTLEKLRTVSEGWIDALEKWKNEVKIQNEGTIERSRLIEDELQQKMEDQEEFHRTQLEILEQNLAGKEKEIARLQERIEELVSASARAQMEKMAADQSTLQQHEWSQMENEDLRSHLLQVDTSAAAVEQVVDQPSADQQQRHVLNLLAQLKQAELRELQWEMLCEEQCQETLQTKERLQMLLEDVPTKTLSAVSSYPSTASTTASNSPRLRRSSFASSTTSSELQLYQQRIEFLEDQLRDVREQINCDHHQFLYEQQKWEVEKKSMGHDVEEVHGVSVKVLKLLLIREKLLKRQETKLQKRVETVKRREQLLQQNQQLMQISLETTMEECAVGLLYLRQLAMMPSTGGQTAQDTGSSPIKPVKLVRLLKKLKNLQLELASGGFGESCTGSRSSAGTS